MVKYSHHWSGEALFSQTGKVMTKIRNATIPLNQYSGHIFTARFQGIEQFDAVPTDHVQDQWDPKSEFLPRRTVVMALPLDMAPAVKIAARCFSKQALRQMFVGRAVGPETTLKDSTGRLRVGWLLSAPMTNRASSVFLVLDGETIAPLNDSSDPLVSFVGGFSTTMRDPTIDNSFLALNYPAAEPEDLKVRIGSLDLA